MVLNCASPLKPMVDRDVFVFMIVRSLTVPAPPALPSKIIYLAAFRSISEPSAEPVIILLLPEVCGRKVTVFTAPAPVKAGKMMGKVSPVET